MTDKIQRAYRSSKNFYDDVLTQKSFLSRLYINLIWHGVDDNVIARKVLSCIPDDFSGSLFDVPVGTAVFTEKKWRSLEHAKITCLDYSQDMLAQAKGRLGECGNISFVQGDVGSLPFPDDSFDIVLSMNGFHAFPDKKSAYREIWRVLKPGGKFIACFYIKGKSRVTDRFVKNFLSRKGWFTPPFQTEDEVRKELEKTYRRRKIRSWGSIIYFQCKK